MVVRRSNEEESTIYVRGAILAPNTLLNCGRCDVFTTENRIPVRAIGALGCAALLIAAGNATAVPVHYDIVFTPAAHTGSFDYDGDAAVNAAFSDFIVKADGFTFDFTNAANADVFKTTAVQTSCANTTTVNDAFEILTHAACVDRVATGYFDGGDATPQSAKFTFDVVVGGQNELLSATVPGNGDSGADGGGTFLAARQAVVATPPSGVPEPETLGLFLLGAMGIALSKRRR